ncbi:MAG: carboxymuconolactone decarboxylase family protein [Proteobacteria bacterium]|nr:carboxymuconolactone decarboxylase family protein [Pseudomonadota bacterium]
MSRLKPLHPKEMDEQQLKYHEIIMQRPVFKNYPKDSPLEGPYNPWVRSPAFARSMVQFSQYVREDGILEERLVELAIIAVGRVWSAEFEFAAHAPRAVKAGISQEAVDAISRGENPTFEKSDERAVYDFSRKLTENRRVDDRTYQAAVDHIGEQGVVELIGLMGFYVMVCMTLNTFEVQLIEGMEKPFPNDS